jgi:hypothetical protein
MSGENPGPSGLNGGRGKHKGLSPNSSDSSSNSSPDSNKSSNKVSKIAKNEQKNEQNHQEVITNPLNQQVIKKVKQLSPELMEELNEFLQSQEKERLNENIDEDMDSNGEEESEDEDPEVAALKEKYLKIEMELEEISQKLQQKGCYHSFKKQLGFLDAEKSDQTVILFENNYLNMNINGQSKPQYKFIVKLKLNDIHFTDPTKVTRQIKDIKGNVNIENAFFNRFNKLLYLCTNDEESFNHLNLPWPSNAFNKGAEIFKDTSRELKYFVAINGVDLNTKTEEDPDFVAICKTKGIYRLQKSIRKENGNPLSTIKGYIADKESYGNVIKTGFKYFRSK